MKIDNRDLPLVSLCIKCYNQKEYVGAALDAAFKQTYSPLEIVISDDCSTDGTYEFMVEKVQEYRKSGGRHKVIYCRTERNNGNAQNFQNVCSMASGELFVQADSDDISFPERVETIVKEWIKNGRGGLVGHGCVCIDEAGRETGGRWVRPSELYPVGAMMAYSADVKRKFPRFTIEDTYDDIIYGHRGMILGGFTLIDKPLVYYRVGSGDSTSGGLHERRERTSRKALNGTIQMWTDLAHHKDNLPTERYEKLVKDFKEYETYFRNEYNAECGANLFTRLKAFHANRKGLAVPIYIKALILWLMPDPMFIAVRNFAKKLLR